uniref:Glycosyltransferase n=1 Tax=Setaria italica TaxID=4555 RepID=K3Z044_SETIT
MARPHAVVVPYPGAGNINPALQLAKLLHHHGVYITFVNTEHNHRVIPHGLSEHTTRTRARRHTEGAGAVRGRDGFRFEAIPHGLSEADRGKQDYGQSLSTTTRCAAPLRDLITRLNGTPGVPPVTCVMPTGLMSFPLGVARDLGIPTMVFWMRDLRERGFVPLKDESFLTNGYLTRRSSTGSPALGDISSFVRTTDPDDSEPSNCTKAGALILNTFEELDADVLAALRSEYTHVYTVGPLGSLLRHGTAADGDSIDSTGLSLWKQDAECLAWLDTQEPRSVVYINFGSHTVMTPEQLAEFAWGLAASGHHFLWSIRDDVIRSGGLPPAFMAETAARCRVTAWCPQEKVLRHPAVGCFLTPNGWNSTSESMAAGVPMVCWPGFADQVHQLQVRLRGVGVGVRLDAEVRREQVTMHVREAMGSEEIKASAARWKAEALAAICPVGSSYENLLSMVRTLCSSSPNPDA